MLDISETDFKKQILKDFYRLKVLLNSETNSEKILHIIDSMEYISEMLDSYFLISGNEYGYNKIRRKYIKEFKENDTLYDAKTDMTIDTLKSNIDIHEKIYNAFKASLHEFKCKKTKCITSDKISSKSFYDVIFNILDSDFNDYVKQQLKANRVFVGSFLSEKNIDILNGSQYSVKFLNKDYHLIETISKFSYTTMFVLIHELSHSYVDRRCGISSVLNPYRETIPYYNELRLMERLNSQNIGLSGIEFNKKTTLMSFNRNLCGRFRIETYDGIEKYFYLLGPLISYYLFDVWKSDPEKAKNLIDIFIENFNLCEPIYLLDKINLDVEQLTSGEIAKKMIRHYNGNI